MCPQEMYGKVMKDAGHYAKRINGQVVVVMPAEKGTPWQLAQEFGKDYMQDELLEEQGSQDSEAGTDEDIVTDKFQDLVEARDGQIEDAVRGSTMAELLALASKRTQQAGKMEEGQAAATASDDMMTQRRGGKRKAAWADDVESADVAEQGPRSAKKQKRKQSIAKPQVSPHSNRKAPKAQGHEPPSPQVAGPSHRIHKKTMLRLHLLRRRNQHHRQPLHQMMRRKPAVPKRAGRKSAPKSTPSARWKTCYM